VTGDENSAISARRAPAYARGAAAYSLARLAPPSARRREEQRRYQQATASRRRRRRQGRRPLGAGPKTDERSEQWARGTLFRRGVVSGKHRIRSSVCSLTWCPGGC